MATGKPSTEVVYRTMIDSGDGTVRVENVAPAPACPHRLVISGASATLLEPYMCQLNDRVVATIRSVEVNVADGVATSTSTGAWGIKNAPYTVVDSGTCRRVGP